MNEVWSKSLRVHFRRLYPHQQNINVEQLGKAMKQIEGDGGNQFIGYAIKSREEDKNNPEDIVSFNEVCSRIESTYKDSKDSMYIEAYFRLIDSDKDGFISYSDLQALTHELGSSCMPEKAFLMLTDRFQHDSTQLDKNTFADIIRQYI